VKAAGFAALLRVLIHALGDVTPVWQDVLWWLAAITMIAGNLMALAQRRIKRMLAYSSIGHAGYLLTAVTSGTEAGAGAFLFYGLAYTLMTLGAFGIVSIAARDGERDLTINDFAGLGRQRPFLAFAMSVFMLSLLGFPGTAGFIGKWVVLSSAVEAGQWSLAVVLVIASVISAGYYLPVIMQIYMSPGVSETSHAETRAVGPVKVVIAVSTTLLLLLGFWPNPALDVAREAGADLKPSVAFTLDARE